MWQKNIVGLLPTKEHTQLGNAIFKECLFYNVLGITKQSHNFSLNKFMESLEFSVVTSLKEGNIEWISKWNAVRSTTRLRKCDIFKNRIEREIWIYKMIRLDKFFKKMWNSFQTR